MKPTCPAPSIWEELVTGLLPEAQANVLLDHASECEHCGPRLRVLTEVLDSGPEPEDEVIRAGLATSGADWQRKMAAAMPPGFKLEARPSRRRYNWWVWGVAAAAAVAVWIGLGGIGKEPSVDKLLAQAYEQNRPFDYRWAGAAHSAVRTERGAGTPASAALLSARAIIARRLGEAPSAALLRQMGEAELLALVTGPAVATLRKARELAPHDAAVAHSLALALAMQGESEEALRLWRAAESVEARFNRALLLERLKRRPEALMEWEALLGAEQDAAWRREAEGHRDRVRGK